LAFLDKEANGWENARIVAKLSLYSLQQIVTCSIFVLGGGIWRNRSSLTWLNS